MSLFVDDRSVGEQLDPAGTAVLVDRHAQDLTVSRIGDVEEILVRIEGQIVRADVLVRIVGEQRRIFDPDGKLRAILCKLKNLAEQRIGHVEIAAPIQGHPVGERQTGRHRGDLMGVRIDLEHASMRYEIVCLIEDVERTVHSSPSKPIALAPGAAGTAIMSTKRPLSSITQTYPTVVAASEFDAA